MRDAVRHALVRALELVLPSRGRHRAAEAPDAGPAGVPVGLWERPWPTPTPVHVIERHAPLRGEDVRLTRPYCLLDRTLRLKAVVRRPRRLVYVAIGGQVRILNGLYARYGQFSVPARRGAAG
ncbi:hypothetical protein ACIBCM_27445 [Streptomyces sp. NPDC051018]|uniref:hypothetical protein n=1 Tax=Streptomyces sp. NPDC051018 TaxID=3365639 RepID=UPI0037ABCD51